MLRWAILAWLCLLASAYDPRYGYRTFNHKLPGERLEQGRFIISPDVFEYGESYVVAEFAQSHLKNGTVALRVKLFLLNDRPDKPTKNCSATLVGNSATTYMAVTSVRRASESIVLVTWRYNDRNVPLPRIQVSGGDLNKCHGLNLIKNLTHEPVVVPTGSNKFVLFAKDQEFCKHSAHYSCWLNYDLMARYFPYRNPRAFDVNIMWSRLTIERLSNDNFQIQDSKWLYLMNYTLSKPVMNLPKVAGDLVGSNMSFCWYPRAEEQQTIRCRQMDDEGWTMFQKTIDFDSARSIVDVRKVSDGEMLLLTADKYCRVTGEECWNLKATRVTRSYSKADTILGLSCTGSTEELVVFGVEKKEFDILVHYGCPNGEYFYFGYISAMRHAY